MLVCERGGKRGPGSVAWQHPSVRIDVITIFPGYLAPLREALLGRAISAGLIDLAVHDLRSWTHDVHQAVDDSPYGGGPGMVMRGHQVEEVSIGDYVLVGGEVAVLVMVEAVVRLLPGVLGNPASAQQDSFSDGLLEGPAYTRPEVWRGLAVPDVLRSGNHAAIARWRRDRALERTAERRPDLLADLPEDALDDADRAFLASLTRERDG
jgi:tRNA G37 N-methylase TrmD